MSIDPTGWRRILIMVLLLILKVLGAVDDETVKVGLATYFGSAGLEQIGKGIAARGNGGVA